MLLKLEVVLVLGIFVQPGVPACSTSGCYLREKNQYVTTELVAMAVGYVGNQEAGQESE